MTNKEIKEVAERTNMTLEQAKKFRSEERKAAQKAIGKFMGTRVQTESKEYLEEASRRAENAAICTEVINMRKKENKEMKKQIKEDTKIQKKIEKIMKRNERNEARIEKRNNKIAAMTMKMNVKAATC